MSKRTRAARGDADKETAELVESGKKACRVEGDDDDSDDKDGERKILDRPDLPWLDADLSTLCPLSADQLAQMRAVCAESKRRLDERASATDIIEEKHRLQLQAATASLEEQRVAAKAAFKEECAALKTEYRARRSARKATHLASLADIDARVAEAEARLAPALRRALDLPENERKQECLDARIVASVDECSKAIAVMERLHLPENRGRWVAVCVEDENDEDVWDPPKVSGDSLKYGDVECKRATVSVPAISAKHIAACDADEEYTGEWRLDWSETAVTVPDGKGGKKTCTRGDLAEHVDTALIATIWDRKAESRHDGISNVSLDAGDWDSPIHWVGMLKEDLVWLYRLRPSVPIVNTGSAAVAV